jgi:hypothetical protein
VVGGEGRIRLNGGNQGDAQPGLLQLAVNAEVVFAKRSSSGDGDTQNGLPGYSAASFAGSLPSTALRQRL